MDGGTVDGETVDEETMAGQKRPDEPEPRRGPLRVGRADVRQFALYLGVGLVGTAGHYLLLVALVDGLGAPPVPSSAAGFTLGAVINYFANYYLTFRSSKRHGRTAAQFFLVALAGLCLNTGVMALMTEVLGVHYLLGQAVATGTVVLLTYLANRFWTFREVRGA